MWKLLNFFFGYDYVVWANVADKGIARVHVDGLGRVFYWRYKSMRVADIIVEPKQVIWLTCSPNKYFGSGNARNCNEQRKRTRS